MSQEAQNQMTKLYNMSAWHGVKILSEVLANVRLVYISKEI